MSTKNRDLGFQDSPPSPVEFPSRRTIHPERRCGIVIGVNEYEADDDDIQDLRGCIHDAEAMYNLMTDPGIGGFKPENVIFLRSDDEKKLPTKRNILDAIESLGEQSMEFDELWFYFAGHGYASPSDRSKDAFLVPTDAVVRPRRSGKGFDRESLVSTKSLHESYFRNFFPTQTIVMFLDCCCSGSMGDASARGAAPATQEAERAAFQEARIEESPEEERGGYYCFQAADRFQAAREGQGGEGGVFTTKLLRALRGDPLPPSRTRTSDPDGYVTVGSISHYLSNAVNGQDPHETISGKSNHPLSRDPERIKANDKRRGELKSVHQWIARLEDSNDFAEYHPGEWYAFASKADSAPPGFVDALIHFGTAQSNRTELGEADKVAAEILSALCEANRAAKTMENLRQTNERLRRELRARPNAPDGRREGTNGGAEPLSDEERRLVRTVVDGVCPHWSSHEGLQGLWTDLSNAKTESEALEAIRKIGDCVRDEFLGENEHRGEIAQKGEIRFRLLSAVIKQRILDQAVRDCQRFSRSKPNNALLAELRGLLRMFGAFCLPSRRSDFN